MLNLDFYECHETGPKIHNNFLVFLNAIKQN